MYPPQQYQQQQQQGVEFDPTDYNARYRMGKHLLAVTDKKLFDEAISLNVEEATNVEPILNDKGQPIMGAGNKPQEKITPLGFLEFYLNKEKKATRHQSILTENLTTSNLNEKETAVLRHIEMLYWMVYDMEKKLNERLAQKFYGKMQLIKEDFAKERLTLEQYNLLIKEGFQEYKRLKTDLSENTNLAVNLHDSLGASSKAASGKYAELSKMEILRQESYGEDRTSQSMAQQEEENRPKGMLGFFSRQKDQDRPSY